MATTLASSAADRRAEHSAPGTGGVNIFGRPQSWATEISALAVLVAVMLLALVIGYAQPSSLQLDIVGRYNTPYLHQFHEPETAAGAAEPSYRWTRERSTILAPGLGRGLWQIDLELSSPVPAEQPKQLVIASATHSWALPLTAEPRHYQLLTPSDGDLTLQLQAPAAPIGNDPRPLGVIFGGAAFEPVVVTPWPPLLLLLYTLATLLVSYLTLRVIGLGSWLALLGPLAGLAVLAWAIAANRAPIGLLMPRLAVLSVFGLLTVVVLRWAWHGLVRFGGLQAEPWLLPALLVTFYVGFWLKSTGLLYPYSSTKDVAWHVRDIQLVLNGRFADFYLPSFFSYGKMPVSEWGNRPPLLPYTPFFHIVAASFAIFPWALAVSVNIFSVIFDTNRVLLIAALALAFGMSSRAALLAALLYAVTPFTFMLHSWGNIPTTFGIWWTLLATTLLVLSYGRWHERKVFAILTAVLLACFLFYFVMAVFTGVFVLLLALALLLWRRGQPRQVPALLGSMSLALVLSIAVYYGFFIPEMIERTLPYIVNTMARGETNTGQADHISWASYWAYHVTHMGYLNYPVRHGVWLPVLLALPGLWLLRRYRFALITLAVWLTVALLFFVVGLRVSMVDKYIFYAAPAISICTAALFERWWRTSRLVPWAVIVIYVLTFASALDIWILRLQRVT